METNIKTAAALALAVAISLTGCASVTGGFSEQERKAALNKPIFLELQTNMDARSRKEWRSFCDKYPEAPRSESSACGELDNQNKEYWAAWGYGTTWTRYKFNVPIPTALKPQAV